jgi:hypothetical protein
MVRIHIIDTAGKVREGARTNLIAQILLLRRQRNMSCHASSHTMAISRLSNLFRRLQALR